MARWRAEPLFAESQEGTSSCSYVIKSPFTEQTGLQWVQ
jgi:hypothetical protein